MNFFDFFFAINFICSKALNLMPWMQQNSEIRSITNVPERVGDRFILTDLVIIYTASLIRETSAIKSKKLIKKELIYSSNTF